MSTETTQTKPWPEVDPRAADYYGDSRKALDVAGSLSDVRTIVDEWDYEQDPHGYCHERPREAALVNEVERLRAALDRVRHVHRNCEDELGRGRCETIRAIDGPST